MKGFKFVKVSETQWEFWMLGREKYDYRLVPSYQGGTCYYVWANMYGGAPRDFPSLESAMMWLVTNYTTGHIT